MLINKFNKFKLEKKYINKNIIEIENKNKNRSGITIFSLAITVIVFLMIAMIAINMYLGAGEGGVIERTLETSKETEEVQLRKELQTYIAQYEIENGFGRVATNIAAVRTELTAYLDKKIKEELSDGNLHNTRIYNIENVSILNIASSPNHMQINATVVIENQSGIKIKEYEIRDIYIFEK